MSDEPVALTHIEHDNLTQKVSAALKAAIQSGSLKAGTRLVETQVASQMGVSRSAVREAFRELTGLGLISTKSRRGTFVTEVTAKEIGEIYSLRSVLEEYAAELTIANGTGPLVAELERLVEELARLRGTEAIPEAIELDLRFHDAICRWSGHQLLYDTWLRLTSKIRVMLIASHIPYNDYSGGGDRHRPIMLAIKAGDSRLARKLIREHINGATSSLLAAMVPTKSEGGPNR